MPLDIKDRFGKPVLMVLPVSSTDAGAMEAKRARRTYCDFLLQDGIPVYPTLERAARALGRVAAYRLGAPLGPLGSN